MKLQAQASNSAADHKKIKDIQQHSYALPVLELLLPRNGAVHTPSSVVPMSWRKEPGRICGA